MMSLRNSLQLLMTDVSGLSQRRSSRGVKYEHIHEITKIDLWFIDKIAILVEMENRLKTEELTVDLLKRGKAYRVP